MPASRITVAGDLSILKILIPFYKDHIYPYLVNMLGNPKPIREVRQINCPSGPGGRVLEIGVDPV